MPRVERAFRVRTGPANTGVGGASAGGLIALHAALERPDLFGRVLAESPALQLDQLDLDMVERTKASPRVPARVFIGMGAAEHLPGSGFYDTNTKRHTKASRALKDALEGRSEVSLVIEPGAEHNERAWAGRLERALIHLYPPK
jgi:enterochelin esterase family protein